MTPFDERFARPVPVVLGDPEPLRQALLVAVERVSDCVVRLEPRAAFTVQERGFLGRTKVVEHLVGPEVIYYADEHGAGIFSMNMFHPPGWPAAQGTPVPAGSQLTIDHRGTDDTFYSFDLDPASSPAKAANDIMGLTAFVFAEQLGPHWQVWVKDLTAGLGD